MHAGQLEKLSYRGCCFDAVKMPDTAKSIDSRTPITFLKISNMHNLSKLCMLLKLCNLKAYELCQFIDLISEIKSS